MKSFLRKKVNGQVQDILRDIFFYTQLSLFCVYVLFGAHLDPEHIREKDL